ncbi:MAG: hypothetical protein COC05_01675 [Gammaproteobacteria bacterium]|nr:MAG: hypothetical protein COC05_01675 [Gammaproteobacteria bacterium]
MENVYQSPASEVVGSEAAEYQPKVFAINGRIGRLRYIAYNMLFGIVSYVLLTVVVMIAAPMFVDVNSQAQSMSQVMKFAGLVSLPMIPYFIIFFILAKRRLNDLNNNGWLSLLSFIPFVGIFLLIYLLFWSGSKEKNNYGPKPAKNSILVILGGILAPILLIGFVGVIAAIAIPAYQDYVERVKEVAAGIQE